MENKLLQISHNTQDLISAYLNSNFAPNELNDIFNYALQSSGKLLRPTIVSIFADAFNVNSTALDNYKIAIELIHVSSLIHDDLPGLDNDQERRGKASVHVKFGEGRAILAGDLMFSKALELLNKSELISVHESQILTHTLIKAYSLLCEGQAAEIRLKEGASIDSSSNFKDDPSQGKIKSLLRSLEDINLKKTGALFVASALGPLNIGNQKKETIESVYNLMKNFSIAFQVHDDLEDSNQDNEFDKMTREYNYLTIMGREKTESYLKSLLENTIAITNSFHPRLYLFEDLIKEVFKHQFAKS